MAYIVHRATLSGGPLRHDAGIADMEIVDLGGQAVLVSASVADGGLMSFALGAGQDARFIDSQDAQPLAGTYGVRDIGFVTIGGSTALVPAGRYDDAVALHMMDAQGGFGTIVPQAGDPADLAAFTVTQTVEVGGRTWLFAAPAGTPGLTGFRVSADFALDARRSVPDTDLTFLGDVTAMESVTIGRKAFLFAASGLDAGIGAWKVRKSGVLVERDSVAPSDGTGLAQLNALEATSVGGRTFLIAASGGTDSLVSYRIKGNGVLKEKDSVMDTQSTRFQDVAAIETFTWNDRAFVLAGGSDDGLSLFELNPDGTLSHLESVADSLDTTLTNVSAISATVIGSEAQVFVAGEGEAGITQFSIDLTAFGPAMSGRAQRDIMEGGAGNDLIWGGAGRDILVGGAGDDRILDGRGRDRMTGGEGADVFVLSPDGMRDRILDFQPGIDRIDLSQTPMLYRFKDLTIRARAMLEYG